MKLTQTLFRGMYGILFAGVLCLAAQQAQAVDAPSTFATGIQVQGEDPGTEFDDWAAVPEAIADGEDNPGGWVDLKSVQVANDNDYLYVRVVLHNTLSVPLTNLSLAFDIDQDLNTGFDVFGIGAIGSEFGYQSDYPYEQATGVFNTGVEGVTDYGGDIIGLAVTYPFWADGASPSGTQMEWAIPRSIALGPAAPGTPVFTSDTFNFTVWVEEGLSDILDESITYTFAAPVGQPGDFDADQDVDGADFLAWQRDQNVGDLTDWDTHYGTPAPALPAISAVPEPSSLVLVTITLFGILLRKRSNSSPLRS